MMLQLLMSFKDNLREEISFQGLQIKEIALRTGISNSTFLSYVDARGSIPNAEIAVKIAQALGVSVEYLVTGKESPKEPVLTTETKKIVSLLSSLEPKEKEAFLTLLEAIAKKH